MAFVVKDSKRHIQPLRLALAGPTNSGKTLSALFIAYGITNDWKKIVIIDTERGRAEFYSERDDLPHAVGAFKHIDFAPPYSPKRYKEAIKAAVSAIGDDGVVILDSFSHAWFGQGGVLQIKEDISKKPGKNSYTAWEEASQIQNDMIDEIFSIPCHLICTMRAKMAHVIEESATGKTTVRTVGLEPVQRNDLPYEFDITLMLDKDTNEFQIMKDVTILRNLDWEGPATPELGKIIFEWLGTGERLDNLKGNMLKREQEELRALATSSETANKLFKSLVKDKKIADMDITEIRAVTARIQEYLG